MESTIKESCSCGATLEYSENVDHAYELSAAFKQERFHEAHEVCREKAEKREKEVRIKLDPLVSPRS